MKFIPHIEVKLKRSPGSEFFLVYVSFCRGRHVFLDGIFVFLHFCRGRHVFTCLILDCNGIPLLCVDSDFIRTDAYETISKIVPHIGFFKPPKPPYEVRFLVKSYLIWGFRGG